MAKNPLEKEDLNVLGNPLSMCSCEPITGWFRDGLCRKDETDFGKHTICCVMTESFLRYSKAQGNDLSTPAPHNSFSGLKEGDRWCVCAERWKQAYLDGMAPSVVLEATNQSTLEIIDLKILTQNAHKPKR